jgi:hypothetical protein
LFATGADHCEHNISFVKSFQICRKRDGRQEKFVGICNRSGGTWRIFHFTTEREDRMVCAPNACKCL